TRHNDVFDQVAKHDAVHATQHRIKYCKQRKHNSIEMRHIRRPNIKRHVILHYIPWNKNFNELSQPHEAIGQKSKATNQRKGHYYSMRSFYTLATQAKSCG